MELPAPLVPVDVDLTKIDSFMLDTVKLLGSELVALSSGDAFKAAVLLWCRAWKQLPAASLPDDDRILASFANVPQQKWQKIKAVAMRGFIKCSDGRLYHKVLSEDARRAWRAVQQRRAAIRKRYGHDTGEHTDESTAVGTPVYTGSLPETGQGRDKERRKKDISPKPPFDGFEDWYSQYPRHVGKGQAEKAYRTATKLIDPAPLLTATTRYAVAVKGKDQDFIPHPATWLNGKRWLDEPAKPTNPNGEGVPF